MARMRERLEGGLCPPTRLDGGVFGDAQETKLTSTTPWWPPSAVDHQLDMANKLLIRA